MKPTRKWTDEQKAGITTVGKGVLVSAAAGSGKTAVLSQRCVHLVCDATPPCDVDELLVVTFTEAAAAEMRARIESDLRDRASRESSARLVRQVALVDRAQISTIHGFCSGLLRQHFHLLGLDPNFTILDPDEGFLLRLEIARELFADRFEIDDSGQFQKLIDSYGDGDDDRLVYQIVRAYELLGSVVDPEQWRQTAIDRIAEAATQPLENSVLGAALLKDLSDRLATLAERCESAAYAIHRMRHFSKYVDQLRDLSNVARHWQKLLKTRGLDALAEEAGEFELSVLPRYPNSLPGKGSAKALLDSVRQEFDSGGATFGALRFSTAEWQHGLREILPYAKLFLDLVKAFGDRYDAAKAEARTLDFTDLERLALRLLRRENGAPSDVARLCHRRFKHVLVDEYQDINDVQAEILKLVSTECVCGDGRTRGGVGSNFFSVGDVKQSIYRFRLAEPARFLERQTRLKADDANGTVIDLRANFRSREPLLDAINAVFERLMSAASADIEYDDSHRLRPGQTYPPASPGSFAGAPIDLHVLPDKIDGAASDSRPDDDTQELSRTEREAELVARLILDLVGRTEGATRRKVAYESPAGTIEHRDIEFRDIAILLRATKFKSDEFAVALRRHGIPVHSDSGKGFFESTEIRDILALLSVLDNQRQDVPLAAVLRSPIASIASAEDALARIRLAYPDAKSGESISFHEAVVRYAKEHDDELAARLKDFLAKLRRWRQMAQRRPLAELIWTIYDDTGVLAFYSGLEGGAQRQANLIHLHERARQFGTFQRQGLGRFIQFLDHLASESEVAQPSIASQADDAVRILSVHKSKGLEFPVVILPDLGKLINMQDCAGSILLDRDEFLGMSVVDEARRIRYPSLAHWMVRNRIRRQTLAEELRVLYVAITRAREHLILIGTCGNKKPDEWKNLYASVKPPLPAHVIQGASSMLDWLGPAAASIDGANLGLMQIIPHSADEIGAWAIGEMFRPKKTDAQQQLAQLIPIEPAPVADASAAALIKRLTWSYPHVAATRRRASESVTGLSKTDAPHAISDAPTDSIALDLAQVLRAARCVDPNRAPAATDIGTWTHLVLQHFDFAAGSIDRTSIDRQIDEMVAQRKIAAQDARHVDREAIEWFLATPTGQMLCAAKPRQLRRELPVYLVQRSNDLTDPLDAMMVRGRVDLLVFTPAGLRIIDYKTDDVSGAKLDERAKIYHGQMTHYRAAIEEITQQKVSGIDLVFLRAHIVRELRLDDTLSAPPTPTSPPISAPPKPPTSFKSSLFE